MSLMAKAKFELFRDAKFQVFYDVQRTWYELYKVQKDISISEKNIEILKLIERLALVRFKSASLENSGTSSQSSAVSSDNSLRVTVQVLPECRPWVPVRAIRVLQDRVRLLLNADRHNGIIFRKFRSWQIYTGYKSNPGDLENNIALLKNQQNSIIAQFNTYLNRPVTSPVYTYENINQGFS